jgi:hypothetical protein
MKISEYRRNIFNVGYHTITYSQIVNLINNILCDKLHFRFFYATFNEFNKLHSDPDYNQNLFLSRPMTDFNKINFYISTDLRVEINISDLIQSKKRDYVLNKLQHGYSFVIFVLDENNNFITTRNIENFNAILFNKVIAAPTYETLNQSINKIIGDTDSTTDNDVDTISCENINTSYTSVSEIPVRVEIKPGQEGTQCYNYLFNDCVGESVRTEDCFKSLKNNIKI